MKNRTGNLVQIWQAHFVVALLVGLVIGTGIGVGEGVWVLLSQGLLGRYNELVAWAIVFDAPTMIVVEFGLAIVSGVVFSLMRLVPIRRRLVSLQLGETVFVIVLATSIWLQGTANPSLIAANPLGVLLPPAVVGLLLGVIALAVSMRITEHALVVQRLSVRHWLFLEVAVVAIAIAFGFSR